MGKPREHEVSDRLIPPAEAASLFGVDPKTLARWSALGLLRVRRTLGGHRRYWESEVRARAAEFDEAVA
jgi:predicted site-specific integrase-resolvase